MAELMYLFICSLTSIFPVFPGNIPRYAALMIPEKFHESMSGLLKTDAEDVWHPQVRCQRSFFSGAGDHESKPDEQGTDADAVDVLYRYGYGLTY